VPSAQAWQAGCFDLDEVVELVPYFNWVRVVCAWRRKLEHLASKAEHAIGLSVTDVLQDRLRLLDVLCVGREEDKLEGVWVAVEARLEGELVDGLKDASKAA